MPREPWRQEKVNHHIQFRAAEAQGGQLGEIFEVWKELNVKDLYTQQCYTWKLKGKLEYFNSGTTRFTTYKSALQQVLKRFLQFEMKEEITISHKEYQEWVDDSVGKMPGIQTWAPNWDPSSPELFEVCHGSTWIPVNPRPWWSRVSSVASPLRWTEFL